MDKFIAIVLIVSAIAAGISEGTKDLGLVGTIIFGFIFIIIFALLAKKFRL